MRVMDEATLAMRLHDYAGTRWIAFSRPFTESLPQVACCYCVFGADGQVLYIGQTLNLRNRFYKHRLSGLFQSDVRIKIRCGEKYGNWAMREARLIRRLRPPLNLRRS